MNAEAVLRAREGQRIVDIALGRGDRSTQVCHYLIIERPPATSWTARPMFREIEQHRDIERVYANARDCEDGNRDAKCLGAFSATYHNGKLVAVEMIDLAKLPALEVAPIKVSNRLVGGDL